MRAAVVLLVLVAVFSTQVSETEALPGWFKKALEAVAKFLRDNVKINLGLTRQGRAAEKSVTSGGISVEDILAEHGCHLEGNHGRFLALKKEAEAAVFAKMPGANKDKKMTGEEQKTFDLLLLKEILAKCLEKKEAA